jgi:peptidoglycan/LPS O-acetylase OafA/YrhL
VRYRPELDGIRALAVLAVFAEHTGYNVGPGYFGVDVFFVLSGYLITSLLLEERAKQGTVDYKAFYARRGLRLYPALVVACALVVVLEAASHLESAKQTGLEIATTLTYTTDFFGAANDTHVWGAWLGHTWSLGVEEQFYLVWPVLLMTLAPDRLRRSIPILAGALAVVAALAAVTLGGHAATFSPLGAAFQLIAGATLAVLPFKPPRWSWVGVPLLYALIWVLSGLMLSPNSARLSYGPMQLFTITSVLLVAWALAYAPRALTNRPIVWLGRRSYGFYLYHLPILALTKHEISSRSKGVAIAFALSLVLSAVSYQWIELPFLRLKGRFVSGQNPKATPHTR